MATYAELYNLHNDSDLMNRIAVATIIAAETVRGEDGGTTNHANRLLWAAQVFQSPMAEAKKIFWTVIAANSTATIAAIQGATDSAIQSNVDAVIDLFATG